MVQNEDVSLSKRPKRQEAMSGEKEKKEQLVEQSETTLKKKLFI